MAFADDLTELENLDPRPGASPESLDEIEEQMAARLPTAIRELLQHSNGIEVWNGVVFYGTDRFVERNQTWAVATSLRGFVAVGDDSGGRALLMEAKPEAVQVESCDVGVLAAENLTRLADSLRDWVARACPLEGD